MNQHLFAEEIYEFLKHNDARGHFEDIPVEDGIAEIEGFLADLPMVTETIKDIEEIADTFDDHEVYVSDVKPLVKGLREIAEKLEANQSRHMVGDTNYEIKQAIHIGDKEIVFAQDDNADGSMYYFVGDYTCNEIMGQYADCQVSDDFLEAMQEFTDRVNGQIEAMRGEANRGHMPYEVFTAEHCHPNDYRQNLVGKIVAIKVDVLRPEYRNGDTQLVLVDGGNGAKANPYGNAVFCYHLNNGKHTRFERYDVQGEVKSEFLPNRAKEKAATIQAEKEMPAQKPKNRER